MMTESIDFFICLQDLCKNVGQGKLWILRPEIQIAKSGQRGEPITKLEVIGSPLRLHASSSSGARPGVRAPVNVNLSGL
jgi:hypothetical protein